MAQYNPTFVISQLFTNLFPDVLLSLTTYKIYFDNFSVEDFIFELNISVSNGLNSDVRFYRNYEFQFNSF